MVSASQIRHCLAGYLSGRVDLDTFEDWFVQNTWNVHQWGSRAAEVLTFAVEESLSEYSSNHLTENLLRSELRSIISSDTIVIPVLSASPQVHSISIRPLVVEPQ